MKEITWTYVKDELPKRAGTYIIAYGDKNVGTGLYKKKKWFLVGFESESEKEDWIEAPSVYAWRNFPDAPARKN